MFGVPDFSTLRSLYLYDLITEVLSTGVQDITIDKIHSTLPQFGRYEIVNLISSEWGTQVISSDFSRFGIINAKRYFQRYIAIRLFRMGASDEYILKVLGYSEGTINHKSK